MAVRVTQFMERCAEGPATKLNGWLFAAVAAAACGPPSTPVKSDTTAISAAAAPVQEVRPNGLPSLFARFHSRLDSTPVFDSVGQVPEDKDRLALLKQKLGDLYPQFIGLYGGGKGHSMAPESGDEQQVFDKDGNYGALLTFTFEAGTDGGNSLPRDGALVGRVEATSAYEPLHLETGLNCLYLWHKNGKPDSVTVWRQTVVETPCPQQATAGGRALSVRRFKPKGNGDYPLSARIDWDFAKKIQTLGLKCGSGWCEIGLKGFSSSPGYPDEDSKVKVVKGWYDEQELAYYRATSNKLERTGVRGVVWPTEELGQLKESDFQRGWKVVGSAQLTGDDTTYRRKFNLRADEPTVISLCNLVTCKDEMPEPINCPGGWYARFSFEGTTVYRCVSSYEKHESTAKIPGVIRWQWLEKDEGFWIRCGIGCCQVKG